MPSLSALSSGYNDLTACDAYLVNADYRPALEASTDLLMEIRPDLLDPVRALAGRSSFISAAEAKKAFGRELQ